MSWVGTALDELASVGTSRVRPHGGSMVPYIAPGDEVSLAAATVDEVVPGDIVLCTVAGHPLLHMVWAMMVEQGSEVALIGNARGKVNGPTADVHGRVTAVNGVFYEAELPRTRSGLEEPRPRDLDGFEHLWDGSQPG